MGHNWLPDLEVGTFGIIPVADLVCYLHQSSCGGRVSWVLLVPPKIMRNSVLVVADHGEVYDKLGNVWYCVKNTVSYLIFLVKQSDSRRRNKECKITSFSSDLQALIRHYWIAFVSFLRELSTSLRSFLKHFSC